MSNSEMVEILTLLLIVFIMLLIVVGGIFICKMILKKNKKDNQKNDLEKKQDKTEEISNSKEKIIKSYTKESIYNFMEFDKVEDNMIIQKQGKRFLMVVECQGINYDLMSEMEKVSVEEGFLQFLNALKYPIQIYVQSRTINLTSSIENYKNKVNEYKNKLDKMVRQYQEINSVSQYNESAIQKYNYEITKQKNLYEYGQDIVKNMERINLNKNVLNKKYYIIIPYYSDDANNPDLDKEEIKNLAFSELYTRAQAVISTLMVCNVNCKILNSMELTNLLYVSFNRDESEVFDIEKAIEAGCEELYSTAPDVLDKKIKALDRVIEERATKRAEEALERAKAPKEIIIEENEKNIETLVDELAKRILEENRPFIGKKAVEESKRIIDSKKKKEGGTKEDEKTKTRTRRKNSRT